MKISLILHSYLRARLPPEARGRAVLDMPPGSQVADVFQMLDLPAEVAWALNNEIGHDKRLPLHDQDELRVFRIGAGG